MRQAMESRGLGNFVGKHELHRPANDKQVDCSQGDDEDVKTREIDLEVKSQKENLGPHVEFDQYLPCTPDQSFGGERHGDDIQPTHSATSPSWPPSRCPNDKAIFEPTAKPHRRNGINEAIHRASTRRLPTPRFDGRYTGRCRRFRTSTTSNILQVRILASNHLITTVTIINKKVQQGLQRTRPRVRSSSSTQITSETATIITKDPALHLMAPQLSERSGPQIAIHPSLQDWHASQRTDCNMNAQFSPVTDLQVRSLLSLTQRSTAQVVMATYVKRPDGGGSEHLLGLIPPNLISPDPELNDLPSEIRGTRTRFNSGRQLSRLWTSRPPLQDLVVKTVRHMHNITDNADNDLDSADRVIAPKTGVRKEDMKTIRAWAFDNDAAPGCQTIVITFPGHRASDRLIKANTASCASHPLEIALSKIELIRQRRNLGDMIKTLAFESYVARYSINALRFKVQAGLVQYHVVLKLLQAIQSECQMHLITNSVYLILLIGHNKAYLLLILSTICDTGCKAQDWVSLLFSCLDSLSRRRQEILIPHQYLLWSVPFYNSVPPSKSLLILIAAAPPGIPSSLFNLWP